MSHALSSSSTATAYTQTTHMDHTQTHTKHTDTETSRVPHVDKIQDHRQKACTGSLLSLVQKKYETYSLRLKVQSKNDK